MMSQQNSKLMIWKAKDYSLNCSFRKHPEEIVINCNGLSNYLNSFEKINYDVCVLFCIDEYYVQIKAFQSRDIFY